MWSKSVVSAAFVMLFALTGMILAAISLMAVLRSER